MVNSSFEVQAVTAPKAMVRQISCRTKAQNAHLSRHLSEKPGICIQQISGGSAFDIEGFADSISMISI